MATSIERATAIIDALRNGATDPAVAIDIANSFCYRVGLAEINAAFGTTYATVEEMTNAHKAAVFVELLVRVSKRVMRETAQDKQAAAIAAAADAEEAKLS
jgi:hypothetical protein